MIETERRRSRGRGVTVSCVDPLRPLNEALMVEVPTATPVARPCEPDALETVATEGFDEAHVTWLVRSSVELSEKVPMAMNCSVAFVAILGLAGITMIELRADGGERR